MGVLIESLGLSSREVVSLVGAGGKTTLMFRLAQELFLSGKKVVTTTTALERLGSGKLKGISPNLVNELWRSRVIDTIIIEADGAAGRPVKAPRENEPVIPTNTTLVVAILGVDGMEMELNEENVFQPERVSKITGIPIGERLTDEAMAILMTHPEGIFKGTPSSSRVIAFLNKVDIPNGVVKAKSIGQKIFEKKHRQIERIVLGQLKNEPPVAEVIFP